MRVCMCSSINKLSSPKGKEAGGDLPENYRPRNIGNLLTLGRVSGWYLPGSAYCVPGIVSLAWKLLPSNHNLLACHITYHPLPVPWAGAPLALTMPSHTAPRPVVLIQQCPFLILRTGYFGACISLCFLCEARSDVCVCACSLF